MDRAVSFRFSLAEHSLQPVDSDGEVAGNSNYNGIGKRELQVESCSKRYTLY